MVQECFLGYQFGIDVKYGQYGTDQYDIEPNFIEEYFPMYGLEKKRNPKNCRQCRKEKPKHLSIPKILVADKT